MEDAKTAEINESEKLMSNDSLDGESKSENFALDILKWIGFALLVCGAIQALISISMDPTIIKTVLPDLGSYFLLIMLAIAIIVRSGSTKELLRRIVALIIIVSAVFGTAFLASKFNYNPDPDADILAGVVGVIAWFSFLRFVLGVPNAVIFVFILLLLVGAVSMAILAFVPLPMNYILSMAFAVVGWGTIWYLHHFSGSDDGDSDGGFDGNDGIFDGGGGDGIFGGDGIGGDGGGDGGGGGGDGGGGDGGGD